MTVASSAPRKPTQRVMCCARTAAPGSSRPVKRRDRVDAAGSSDHREQQERDERRARRTCRASRARTGEADRRMSGRSRESRLTHLGGASMTTTNSRSGLPSLKNRVVLARRTVRHVRGCSPAAGARALPIAAVAASGAGDDLRVATTIPSWSATRSPSASRRWRGCSRRSPEARGAAHLARRGFTQYAYAFVQQDADMADIEAGSTRPRRPRARPEALPARPRLRAARARRAARGARGELRAGGAT